MEDKDDFQDEWGENYEYGEELNVENLGFSKTQSNFADLSSFKKSSDGCYIFMTVDEVKKMIPQRINQLRDEYGIVISNDEALACLRHFIWNVDRFKDKWFENEQKLKIEIGLIFDEKKLGKKKDLQGSLKQNHGGYCVVCYSDFDASIKSNDIIGMPLNLQCGHQFCVGCWKEYLAEKIKESGVEILQTLCQQSGCNCIVPHSIFLSLFDGKYSQKFDEKQQDAKLIKKYELMHCKSFTDNNKSVKWCPYSKEGCEYAAQRASDFVANKLVGCICGNIYCFTCGQESHWPATCEMFKQWDIKNSSDGENVLWIKAYTKACPKCNVFIEKNQGCNHMTCKSCKHEFCWLCFADWFDHCRIAHTCDPKFQADAKIKNMVTDAEKAKADIQMYAFYYERFINHEKSQKLAKSNRPFIKQKIQRLHVEKQYSSNELTFLEEGIEEVIICRQVLKFTYVNNYLTKEKKNKKDLLEFQQKMLEEALDRLHEQVEKPLDKYLDPETILKTDFFLYKSNLVNLTQVARKAHEAFLSAQYD